MFQRRVDSVIQWSCNHELSLRIPYKSYCSINLPTMRFQYILSVVLLATGSFVVSLPVSQLQSRDLATYSTLAARGAINSGKREPRPPHPNQPPPPLPPPPPPPPPNSPVLRRDPAGQSARGLIPEPQSPSAVPPY
ncbi:hypothetical protein CPB83DRAFT_858567 [Crepidotus variabilis]|uniref:Uncharacterized protein n=1 Tax=Crepidotus variabilis TaxID=179855 RepID=A0A9P6JMW1_9AGAR|nr:hypothetical protein CPB83DRAFT_858567 [Crepidotus variabilis]